RVRRRAGRHPERVRDPAAGRSANPGLHRRRTPPGPRPVTRHRPRSQVGAMWVPAGAGADTRRAVRHAAKQLRRDASAAEDAVRRAECEREGAERATPYLPKAGEPGPAALRSWRRFALRPHRGTSAVLSFAYPFLAEAGLGS